MPSPTAMAFLSSSPAATSPPPAVTAPSSSAFSLPHTLPPFRRLTSPSFSLYHHLIPVPTRKNSSSLSVSTTTTVHPSTRLRCHVALGSDAAKFSEVGGEDPSPSPSAGIEGLSAEELEELQQKAEKIGSKVRVKVPLKVYHVPRVPEFELTGLEGEVKQYVPLWKGKRISANLPFKVEFKTEVEGRGLVKFFAHLREEEIEFI